MWLLGKDVNLIGIEDLNKPFVIIICAFVALGIMAFFAPLPEVKAEGEDEDATTSSASSYAAGKTSVLQFPHLLLGCLALFLYVGVETVSLGTLVDYANSLGLPGAANYSSIMPTRWACRVPPTTLGLPPSASSSATSAASSSFRNTSARPPR